MGKYCIEVQHMLVLEEQEQLSLQGVPLEYRVSSMSVPTHHRFEKNTTSFAANRSVMSLLLYGDQQVEDRYERSLSCHLHHLKVRSTSQPGRGFT